MQMLKKKQNKKTAACYVARVCALCDPTKCTHFTVDLICRKTKKQRKKNEGNGWRSKKKRSQNTMHKCNAKQQKWQ